MLPALLLLDKVEDGGGLNLQQHVANRWQTYAKMAFDKYAVHTFFNDLCRWGAHTNAVISGAFLYMSEGVVWGLPPFSNFSDNISWIDDHLRYAIHKELGDFCLDTVINDAQQLLHVRLDESQVIKCRTGFNNLPVYTIEVYLPTLLRGAIFDRWLSDEPIAKRRKSEILLEERERWAQAKSGELSGPLAVWIRRVREGSEPPNDAQKDELKHYLKKTAKDRLQIVKDAWRAIKSEDQRPTFASAWAEGTLPDWVKGELRDNMWYSMDAFLASESWATSLDTMIQEAIAYLSWVEAWPRVLHVVRALEQGTVPSDIGWYEVDARVLGGSLGRG